MTILSVATISIGGKLSKNILKNEFELFRNYVRHPVNNNVNKIKYILQSNLSIITKIL